MEWTNDLIFEFLNIYQTEPSLWNFTAPEHKNKNDAYDAWNRVKSKFYDGTIPIKELKKKRDNLMSTYRRQRTKVRESMESGSGADDVYKPEWPFYTLMATFLDDVYKPRKTKHYEVETLVSLADDSELLTLDTNKAVLQPSLLNSTSTIDPLSADNSFEPQIETSEAKKLRNLPDSQSLINSSKQGSKKRLHDDNSILNAIQRLENVSRVVNISQQQPILTHPQDEFYFFALSIAAQLRNLPLPIAIETQSKIQNTLSTARLSSMISNSPPTSSYNCNSPTGDQSPYSTSDQDTRYAHGASNVKIEQNFTQQSEHFVPKNIKQEPESVMD